MNENKFEKAKQELRNCDDKIGRLQGERYQINKKYLELLKGKCKESIGRCFKEVKENGNITYYKVIDIDKGIHTFHGEEFNEYQYPSIYFEYPYNKSLIPFNDKDMFSREWGKSYEEITKDEFNEKFKEVNDQWINKMIGDDKQNEKEI